MINTALIYRINNNNYIYDSFNIENRRNPIVNIVSTYSKLLLDKDKVINNSKIILNKNKRPHDLFRAFVLVNYDTNKIIFSDLSKRYHYISFENFKKIKNFKYFIAAVIDKFANKNGKNRFDYDFLSNDNCEEAIVLFTSLEDKEKYFEYLEDLYFVC